VPIKWGRVLDFIFYFVCFAIICYFMYRFVLIIVYSVSLCNVYALVHLFRDFGYNVFDSLQQYFPREANVFREAMGKPLLPV
jgi:hypothetical protein